LQKFFTLIFPKNFEEKIGFNHIRKMVSDYCISEMGKARVDRMQFIADFDLLKKWLGQVEEFRQILMFGKPFPSQNYFNLIPALQHIQLPGTCLLQEHLFDLKTSIQSIYGVIKYLEQLDKDRFKLLSELISDIELDTGIIKEADRIMDDRGKIRDNASEKLKEIRNKLIRLEGESERIVHQLLIHARKNGWINPNDEATLRNGRAVIPLPATHKRKIKGFIQDESASGQTVYLEPSESLEINNEIRELENEEKREIRKILLEFTNYLRPYTPELIKAYHFLGLIDFIRAKAQLALKLNAGIPLLNPHPVIQWWEAKHPLLYLAHLKQKREIIPLEINLNLHQRILVISGPNAGGKSVCLKTVGLLQYMLQCGLAVPMRETSEAGIFKDMFIDIGDEQSIEDDLSTYTSHLRNMKVLLQKARNSSLFLIDEFGSGTEPQLGGAIAEAILENLNSKKTFGIITTHYSNLKLLADKTEGLVNGAMLFDTRQMQPLFILRIGQPGSSFAFEMARKTGMPWYILRSVEKKAGKTQVKFDKQLQQLEVEKREISDKQKSLAAMEKTLAEITLKYEKLKNNLDEQKNHILKQAKLEAKRIIEESNKTIENTIREIKEAQAEKEKTKLLREKLKLKENEITGEADKTTSEKDDLKPKIEKVKKAKPSKNQNVILVGNRVRIPPQNTVGEVVEISGQEALISFGSVIMKAPLKKLVNVGEEEYHQKVLIRRRSYNNIINELNEKMANFKLSMDLRGKRAEEAITLLRKYIDEAILLSIKEVKILHGKGNGILRDVIRDQLRNIPEVKNYKDEKPDFGGSGITIVILK
jgi:DNA mismatch repair protein MutS2